jgi:signal peptidase I
MTQTPVDQPKKAAPPESSIKETLESIIVAFVLAFVFRAFVVEAFVIPTGSMAPTLLGQHLNLTDPTTGYSFKASYRDTFVTGIGTEDPFPIQGQVTRRINGQTVHWKPLEARSPMSDATIYEKQLPTEAGDRILVLKYLYALHEPDRWDVVVFKNPENPTQNYIKRLVGLPEEQLWLVRGNVYTAPLDGDQWQVRRKPIGVQREVWLPIYHSRYVPQDTPVEPNASPGPWQPRSPDAWRYTHQGRRFVFQPNQQRTGDALRFQFDRRWARDYYAYNVFDRQEPENLVEDLRIAVAVNPAKPGVTVKPELHTEFFDLRAVVTDGEPAVLQMRSKGELADAVGDWIAVGTPASDPIELPADTFTDIEFWHVDHRLTLWVDGDMVAMHDIPVTADGAAAGNPFAINLRQIALDAEGKPRKVAVPPEALIGVSGGPMVLSDVNLDRDLYYTYSLRYLSNQPLETRAIREPVALQADQFFCLGDNSPQSKDSRLWQQVDPWVRYHTPEHGPRGVPEGVVPRKLMIGKAFFVYFPAMLRLDKNSRFGLIPNFGEMRFIR